MYLLSGGGGCVFKGEQRAGALLLPFISVYTDPRSGLNSCLDQPSACDGRLE
jgi:hypothetical protein